MGIQKSGIVGPFRNKIGPVVGRRHMGQDLIVPLPRISLKPATDKQLQKRAMLGLLNGFLNIIRILVNPGFKAFVKHNSSVNVAFSYNYEHAFIINGEEISLNYPKLVYSRGHIATPDGASLSSSEKQITYSWDHQKQSAYCQYSDLASFLLYNPAKDNFKVIQGKVNRRAQNFPISVAAEEVGDLVHCYMSFASADGKLQGDSMYVGAVTVVG